MCSSVQDF